MIIKLRKYLFLCLLLFSCNVTSNVTIKIEKVADRYKYPPVLTEKEVSWNHPVLKIFEKYGIQLHKIHYFSDGTCPAFHVNFETYSKTKDFHTTYEDILKANYNFPYALIDKKKKLMINVGWSETVPSNIKIVVGKPFPPALPKPSCEEGSRAMSFKFRMNSALKKSILSSPYKATMRRQDGKELIAYLYAENGVSKSAEYYADDGNEKTTTRTTGNFYIYLYDPVADKFFPKKVAAFYSFEWLSMDLDRSDFIVLPHNKKGQSDVLLIGTFVNSNGDQYEAYGFSEDLFTLKKYRFVKKKSNSFAFYGRLFSGDNQVYGYTSHQGLWADKAGGRIHQFSFEVSDKSGDIKVTNLDT